MEEFVEQEGGCLVVMAAAAVAFQRGGGGTTEDPLADESQPNPRYQSLNVRSSQAKLHPNRDIAQTDACDDMNRRTEH